MDDWIKCEKGRPHNLVSIPAARARGADERYSVKVHTSDVRGAGTDADVSIILHGTAQDARSDEFVLADSANNFERGNMDEFPLNLKAHFPLCHFNYILNTYTRYNFEVFEIVSKYL